jgi:predicted XRE-type DNA-binding protein
MNIEEAIELVRGSGNVFSDFGYPNAAAEQLKAMLAGLIIGVLDKNEFTVRKAEERTGIAAADFSRIRRVKLDRFTIDRLMTILDRLGQEVDVQVSVHPRGLKEAVVGA